MELFVFTRRTPRALETIISEVAPHLSRKAGTRKYMLNWRNTERTQRSANVIRIAHSAVERVKNGRNIVPTLDLELAAVKLLEAGYDVEHIEPKTNSDGVTRPGYIRVAA